MATALTSAGTVGSENFQPSEQGELESQPNPISVTNGPSAAEGMETAVVEKDPKKQEDIVKKFDNVNYVEAPLPKTNPWNKKQNVSSNPASEPGKLIIALKHLQLFLVLYQVWGILENRDLNYCLHAR